MLLFLFFLFMISGKISVVDMVFIWEGWFLFSDITVEIYGKEGRVGYGAISVNSIPKTYMLTTIFLMFKCLHSRSFRNHML